MYFRPLKTQLTLVTTRHLFIF